MLMYTLICHSLNTFHLSNIGFLTASVLGAMITALSKTDPGSTLLKVLILGTKNFMTCDDPYSKGSTEWDKSHARELNLI